MLIKKSFGLHPQWIMVKHIVRNSLIPLFSILGPIAAALVTGSFVVEFIFAIPGLGKAFVKSVIDRDYTLLMGLTVCYSSLLILFNTVTELGLGLLDPRLDEAEP